MLRSKAVAGGVNTNSVIRQCNSFVQSQRGFVSNGFEVPLQPRSVEKVKNNYYVRNLSKVSTVSKVSKVRKVSKVSKTSNGRKLIPDDGKTLSQFISQSHQSNANANANANANSNANSNAAGLQSADQDDDGSKIMGPVPIPAALPEDYMDDEAEPYRSLDEMRRDMMATSDDDESPHGNAFPQEDHVLKFHLKTYGCQMNVSDSDIVRAILLSHNRNESVADESTHVKFEETNEEMDADVLLTNTCAIRENAESKVWHRLKQLRAHDAKFPLDLQNAHDDRGQKKKKAKKRIIGVLGCMAERLKEDMFKQNTADLIVGPDAYRDLPRLIHALAPTPSSTSNNGHSPSIMERALNVELSFDETYADIKPIRKSNNENDQQDVSAFVSVMRGCNNMCSYCVVPFTRGRERSRDLESIVAESTKLYEQEGVKEIILLGQNVNSYHDRSESAILAKPAKLSSSDGDDGQPKQTPHNKKSSLSSMYKSGYKTSNDGFTNMFNLRGGSGYYFVDLVEAISDISPELRVRFTSPHPKDYPPELLSLMAERYNVCNQLHMPAQSGSTSVLKRMRRGYSREAYMELIDDVKSTIPDVSISSDFITGFCGETEEEHQDTLNLMDYVKYDQAYMFAYSMRGKTHAHRTMKDDVPEDVKSRRLQEIISMFRNNVQKRNDEVEVGQLRLVLVEGESKKSKEGNRTWGGRTDQNKRITFPVGKKYHLPHCWSEEAVSPILQTLNSTMNKGGNGSLRSDLIYDFVQNPKVPLQAGDYAVLQVTEARGHTLRGRLLWRATMKGFHEMGIIGNLNDLPLFSNATIPIR